MAIPIAVWWAGLIHVHHDSKERTIRLQAVAPPHRQAATGGGTMQKQMKHKNQARETETSDPEPSFERLA